MCPKGVQMSHEWLSMTVWVSWKHFTFKITIWSSDNNILFSYIYSPLVNFFVQFLNTQNSVMWRRCSLFKDKHKVFVHRYSVLFMGMRERESCEWVLCFTVPGTVHTHGFPLATLRLAKVSVNSLTHPIKMEERRSLLQCPLWLHSFTRTHSTEWLNSDMMNRMILSGGNVSCSTHTLS